MNIIFIEQFFYPEGWAGAEISRDIAKMISERISPLKVFCGDVQYVESIKVDNFIYDKKSLHINKVKLPIKKDKNFIIKFSNQLYFCLITSFKILKEKNLKLIICQTNPPLILIFVYLIYLFKKVPYIIISMDVYPDILFKFTRLKKYNFIYKILNFFFNNAYKNAKNIVALGESMSEILIKKKVNPQKISIIQNWATGDISLIKGKDNFFRKKLNLKARKILIYSGNLGIAHEWETLLNTFLDDSINPEDFQLLFFSSGTRILEAKKYYQEKLNKRNEKKVIFQDIVPNSLLNQSMGLADLATVTLRNGYSGLVLPSKLIGLLARGIPILYIGPKCDVSSIILQSNCGFCFASDDINGILDFLYKIKTDENILSKAGKNGLEYYQDNFCREKGLNKYYELLKTFKSF